MQLQKSLWRRLASNKPAERTLEKGGDASERGPSAEPVSAGNTVGSGVA